MTPDIRGTRQLHLGAVRWRDVEIAVVILMTAVFLAVIAWVAYALTHV